MKFKFIGVPGEKHEALSMYGVNFPLGEAVEIEGKGAEKLKSHPHFEAVADGNVETKTYDDGTQATGPAPLPDDSPAEPAKRGPGRPKKV